MLVFVPIMLLLLVSCYTATESTPRIKAQDVERIPPTAEQLVVDTNFVQRGCYTWPVGKRFVSIDDALSPMLRPEADMPLVESGLQGRYFVYRGIRQENTYGDKSVVYLLYECDSVLYSYYTGKSLEELELLDYRPLIPSLVDVDALEKARRLFVGKQLYILTRQWYSTQGEPIDGLHYVPVVVEAIEPGSALLPFAVVFRDGRGVCAQVYISTKSSLQTQMLAFDRLFAFDNPRNEHPEITDVVWEAITQGRLLVGMTKNECRLCLGLPSEVKKVPTYSGLKEQWLYNTGAYLFFSDGLLEEFRQ